MADQLPRNPLEIFVQTPAALIRDICRSVAEAQRELDKSALLAQTELENNYPGLHKIGYQVTWYHIPEVTVELKMAMHFNYHKENENDKNSPETFDVLLGAYNGKYKQSYDFEEEGSSTLKFRLVPIPSPIGSNETPR